MSRRYQVDVTLTIDGEERDCSVRGLVFCEPQFGGAWGGSVDGEIEVCVPEADRRLEWVSLESLNVDAKDRERAEEALCDECSNDDRDARRYGT